MIRLALLALLLGGCSLVASPDVVAVRELAGAWRGRLALQQSNATATMTVKDDGGYQGALHLEGGEDRAFNGAIVIVRPGRLRYQGSHGNGMVIIVSQGAEMTLRFVPDGGGGGGAFTRAR